MSSPNNYIVLRHSPDWLSYDLEQSRSFCATANVPEGTVLDFVALWDQTMAVDYRRFRHVIKRIALANFHAVAEGRFCTTTEFEAIATSLEDLIVFVDDDDWLAPDLFVRLRHMPHLTDGAMWGSIRLGPVFSHPPQPPPYGIFHPRPIDNVLYTNNYAVSGLAMARLGWSSLYEHFDAQQQYNAAAYRPATVSEYLSVANKHPCSTLAAKFFLESQAFRADPRRELMHFNAAIAEVVPPPSMGWVKGPLHCLRILVAMALNLTLSVAEEKQIAELLSVA